MNVTLELINELGKALDKLRKGLKNRKNDLELKMDNGEATIEDWNEFVEITEFFTLD